ncbi:MAG: hypothetical protein ABI288_07420, partial [Ginsengibacter sp.]
MIRHTIRYKTWLRPGNALLRISLLLLFQQILLGQKPVTQINSGPQLAQQTGLRLSTFDIDVTPPIGYPLAYDIDINKWDLGLRAKGIVLLGAGQPIVLCAIDWIAIGNEGMDAFKNALAAAVGTTPHRVTVNTLHQHDAPRFDEGAEQILLEAGIDPHIINKVSYDGTFGRET